MSLSSSDEQCIKFAQELGTWDEIFFSRSFWHELCDPHKATHFLVCLAARLLSCDPNFLECIGATQAMVSSPRDIVAHILSQSNLRLSSRKSTRPMEVSVQQHIQESIGDVLQAIAFVATFCPFDHRNDSLRSIFLEWSATRGTLNNPALTKEKEIMKLLTYSRDAFLAHSLDSCISPTSSSSYHLCFSYIAHFVSSGSILNSALSAITTGAQAIASPMTQSVASSAPPPAAATTIAPSTSGTTSTATTQPANPALASISFFSSSSAPASSTSLRVPESVVHKLLSQFEDLRIDDVDALPTTYSWLFCVRWVIANSAYVTPQLLVDLAACVRRCIPSPCPVGSLALETFEFLLSELNAPGHTLRLQYSNTCNVFVLFERGHAPLPGHQSSLSETLFAFLSGESNRLALWNTEPASALSLDVVRSLLLRAFQVLYMCQKMRVLWLGNKNKID